MSSNIFGVEHTLGLNDLNQRIAAENRGISNENQARKQNYLVDIANVKSENKNLDDAKTQLDVDESATGGEGGVSIAEAGGLVSKSFEKVPLPPTTIDPSAVNILSPAKEGVVVGNTKFLAPVQAVADESNVVKAVSVADDVAGDGAEAVKGLGKLGAAGAVLQGVVGAVDLGKDISLDIKNKKFGQIAGANDFERVGNVSDMVGGAAATIFGVGSALDASLIFAPEGLALQGVAALAGIGAGVADFIGDEKEKSEAAAPTPTTAIAKPSTVGSVAFQAGGSSGQQVRVS